MNNNNKTIDQIRRLRSRVTIITPTYNRANLIEFTMQSVIKQSFIDYTYIVIDDGSTDDTKKVVQNYIKDKKNCFYLYHDNMGEAETANVGWSLSHGDFFVQVNSDDTIEPDLLKEMVKVLDNNPNCVVAYPDFKIFNNSGKVIENFKNMDWDFISALSAFSCYAAAPGAMIRKTAFAKLDKIKDGKYKYINDVKMYWNMALEGEFIHVPKSLASWRSHNDGISINRYKSIEEVMRWADEYFSQKGLPKKVKDAEVACRLSIDRHCTNLVINSNIEDVVVNFVKHLQSNNLTIHEDMQLMKLRLAAMRESFKSQIELLDSQNRALEKEIMGITRSTSWRITKPLRQASLGFKKITNKK